MSARILEIRAAGETFKISVVKIGKFELGVLGQVSAIKLLAISGLGNRPSAGLDGEGRRVKGIENRIISIIIVFFLMIKKIKIAVRKLAEQGPELGCRIKAPR